MTTTAAERRAQPTARSLKAPRLPNGYDFEDRTVREFQRWFADGYASSWGEPDIACARELAILLDQFNKATDPGLQIRLAKELRKGRRELGLSGPSPIDEKPLSEREQPEIDWTPTPEPV